MQSHHLALSGAREEGGISHSSSLISHLTKASDEDNKRSPSPALCLSRAPSLICLVLSLCLTVRVLVEHGSSDTFHISSPLLCVPSHVCARDCILACIAVYSTVLCFQLCILGPGPCVLVSLCARWSRRTPTRAPSHRFGFRHCSGRTLMAGQGPRILSIKLFIACVSICALFFLRRKTKHRCWATIQKPNGK